MKCGTLTHDVPQRDRKALFCIGFADFSFVSLVLPRHRFGIRNGFFMHGWFGFLISGFLAAGRITSTLMDTNTVVPKVADDTLTPVTAI